MLRISVVHTKAARAAGAIRFYVGRPSALGNPYLMQKPEERAMVISGFEQYLLEEVDNEGSAAKAAFERIVEACRLYEHVELACWCAPRKCHADVIRSLVLEQLRPTPDPEECEEHLPALSIPEELAKCAGEPERQAYLATLSPDELDELAEINLAEAMDYAADGPQLPDENLADVINHLGAASTQHE